MKTITKTVRVTREDIRKAAVAAKNKRLSRCRNCPIALAINRVCGVKPHVGGLEVTIRGVEEVLPKDAQKFIRTFDNAVDCNSVSGRTIEAVAMKARPRPFKVTFPTRR